MIRIGLDTARALYDARFPAQRRRAASALGSLAPVFERFFSVEARSLPGDPAELDRLFQTCTDPEASPAAVAHALRVLAPGGGAVGLSEVLYLVDALRGRIADAAMHLLGDVALSSHVHAFGSGGDFAKTGHATTNAAITVAPRVPICKTGTTNVTSRHGSAEAAAAMGCSTAQLSAVQINADLRRFGFAFVPLAALGFAYGGTLTRCRHQLWMEAVQAVDAAGRNSPRHRALADTAIPLDIFKIVSPNAQLLNPRWHATGVCHLSMIPYVLGIFLHLGTRGMIVHSLDGIDELANGHSLGEGGRNNLVVEITADSVLISQFAPEDIGLARCGLADIEEEPAAAQDAGRLIDILDGKDRGPRRDFVVMNGAALLCEDRDPQIPFPELLRARIGEVEALIDSGESRDNLLSLLAALRAREETCRSAPHALPLPASRLARAPQLHRDMGAVDTMEASTA